MRALRHQERKGTLKVGNTGNRGKNMVSWDKRFSASLDNVEGHHIKMEGHVGKNHRVLGYIIILYNYILNINNGRF